MSAASKVSVLKCALCKKAIVVGVRDSRFRYRYQLVAETPKLSGGFYNLHHQCADALKALPVLKRKKGPAIQPGQLRYET